MSERRSLVKPEDVLGAEAVQLGKAKKPVRLLVIAGAAVAMIAWNLWLFLAVKRPVSVNAPTCSRPQPMISNEVAVQVLAAAMAALFVLRQLEFSSYPAIGYATARSSTSRTMISDAGNAIFWQVDLLSSGSGPAQIEDVHYFLRLPGETSPWPNRSYEAVRKRLIAVGLTEYKYFLLWRISNGAVFAPQQRVTLLECEENVRNKLEELNVVITFRGRMGDRWMKRIMCIPDRRPPMKH